MIKIEEYINKQSGENQELLYILREIIININVGVEEHFSWKVPYYKYRKKGFCYLNVNKKGFIELGLINGNQFEDKYNLLESAHLKQVRHLKFRKVDAIDFEIVETYLQIGIKLIDKSN